MPPTMRAATLLLVDARFPAGAHAHSAGMERAVAMGLVRDLADVAGWAHDVLHTAGLTAAAVAARACRLAQANDPGDLQAWDDLDAEVDARLVSPAQRRVSRRLGRQLLRSARRVWQAPLLDDVAGRWPGGPHRPVAWGAAVGVTGGTPDQAAQGEAFGSVTTPVTAAVRLLGLDPVDGAAVVARLASDIDDVSEAATLASFDDALLPARSAPVLDLCAELHGTEQGALFAS